MTTVLDGEEITQELFVGRAQKKAERERELRAKFEAEKMDRISKFQGVNLYVKNLDDAVTDDMLRDEFAAMGTITSARVMKDSKTGLSRGFGFVCFSTPEEATRAVNEMNGKLVSTSPSLWLWPSAVKCVVPSLKLSTPIAAEDLASQV